MEDVREARTDLTDAINRRDLAAIRSRVYPSYQATSHHGVTLNYDQMMTVAEKLLHMPQFQETVEIDSAEVAGETAQLTTTRRDSFTTFWWFKRQETTRQVETRRMIEGRWMIVGERQL